MQGKSYGKSYGLGRRREAVLGTAFAEANGLRPGDTLTVVINSRGGGFHLPRPATAA